MSFSTRLSDQVVHLASHIIYQCPKELRSEHAAELVIRAAVEAGIPAIDLTAALTRVYGRYEE